MTAKFVMTCLDFPGILISILDNQISQGQPGPTYLPVMLAGNYTRRCGRLKGGPTVWVCSPLYGYGLFA